MSARPAVVVVAAAAVDVVDIGPHASRVFIETRSSRLSTLSHVNILDSRQWTGCQGEGGHQSVRAWQLNTIINTCSDTQRGSHKPCYLSQSEVCTQSVRHHT